MEDAREALDYAMDEWAEVNEPKFTWGELCLMLPFERWNP